MDRTRKALDTILVFFSVLVFKEIRGWFGQTHKTTIESVTVKPHVAMILGSKSTCKLKHETKMLTKPNQSKAKKKINVEIHRHPFNYWGNYMKYVNGHSDYNWIWPELNQISLVPSLFLNGIFLTCVSVSFAYVLGVGFTKNTNVD